MLKRYISHDDAKSGIYSLLDQIVVSATNFLSGVIIGHTCSRTELGVYLLGFTIILIMMTLQDSLILSPYTIYSPRFIGEEHVKYGGSSIVQQFFLSIGGTFIIAAAACLIGLANGPKEVLPTLKVLAVLMIFILLKEFNRRKCFAEMQMKTALILDGIISFGQIAGIVYFAYIGSLSAYITYMIMGISSGVVSVGWVILSRKEYLFRLADLKSAIDRNWKVGKWIFAGDLVFILSRQLYPWMITFFSGAEDTGVFAACWGIVSFSNPLLLGTGNYLGPRIVRACLSGRSELKKIVRNSTVILGGLTTVFCFIVLLLGDRLLSIFYGIKYVGNSRLAFILALGILAWVLGLSTSFGFWAMERADANFRINMTSFIFTITFGIWLVKISGPLGAAWGFLIGNILAAGIRMMAFLKHVDMPIKLQET